MTTHPGWAPPGGANMPVGPGYDGYDPRLADVTVTWGQLIFRTTDGEPPNPARDVSIGRAGLRGWWEPAMDITSSLMHPTGNGVLLGERRLAARTVEVKGTIKGRDFKHVLEVKALMTRQRDAVLTVADRSLTSAVDVRIADLRFEDVAYDRAGYSLTLLAADPLRYSGSQVLRNGSNVLVNRGDVDAFPVLELVGPHDAMSFAHPGGTFVYPALESGWPRVIDCRNGDVWTSQGKRTFPGFSGAWPVSPSGGSTWTVSGLGSGSALVKRFEAWS